MRGYGAFAWYYDELTENVSYQKRADYFLQLIEKFGSSGPIVLDLACGTGSLSMELAQRGCDVIGVDASEDMLSVAQEKAMDHPEWDILYLCQSMTELDLFGTVDTTICALDSINHLTDPRQVQQTFQKVSLFTAPGGLFLFDANTPYKHRELLGNSCYIYEFDDLFCAWQNIFEEATCTVTVQLDFFSEENGHYIREQEYIVERAYTQEELSQWLEQAGFELLAVYGEDSLDPPAPDCQRWIFAARKK